MSLGVAIAVALTIFIPGILGAIRFGKISPTFHPFIYCIWVGCVNESVAIALVLTKHQTGATHNIYVLVEPVLLLFFFYKSGLLTKRTMLYLITGTAIVWLVENLIDGTFSSTPYYYKAAYSFMILVLSIALLNKLLSARRRTEFYKPLMLLSICFIVYYTLKIIVDAFWQYALNSESNFIFKLGDIFMYLNVLINLLFALAILWMPRKREYTLQLS